MDEPATRSGPPASPGDVAATVGAFAPFLILAYCLLLLALRLQVSPYLDAGEAALLGRTDMRWLYEGDPPLRHWLARILLELFEWDWPEGLGVLHYGALALYLFSLFASARRLGGPRAGGLALIAAGLAAPAVLFVAIAPAKAALAMGAAAGSFYALLRTLRTPSWGRFLTFGLALTAAILSAFEFLFLLVPLLLGLAISREGRGLFRGPGLWAALGLALLLSAPSLLLAGGALWSGSVAIGFDGAAAPPVLYAALLWLGALAALWSLGRLLEYAYPPLEAGSLDLTPRAAGTILIGATAGGLALFAAAALFGLADPQSPRALPAILALAPLAAALRYPLTRGARPLAALAALFYLAAFAGLWTSAYYSAHRFALPYDALAAQIRRAAGEPLPIRATDPADAANVLLALEWPGARSGAAQPLGLGAIVLWRGRGEAPPDLIPPAFGPAAGIVTVVIPYENRSGEEAVFSFQRVERLGAAPIASPGPGGE